ncbi:MAG: fibro-slime domain-containing protein [Planctomycetota bacterium]
MTRSLTSTLFVVAGTAAIAGAASSPFGEAGEDNSHLLTEGTGGTAELPETIELMGVVRDFRADHPDFQRQPKRADGRGAFGHYYGMVQPALDDEGKPVWASGGHRLSGQWKNSSSKNILPNHAAYDYYDAMPGDKTGSGESSPGSATTSAETFAEWYRDVPGQNVSIPMPITLRYDASNNKYVFDDRSDPVYSGLGGFFPINGEGYGDYSGGKNFHFTFELDTEFTYTEGVDQTFLFNGDDDVWVFIDGKLVVDIGGVHGRVEQRVELDRLNWLENGETYSLKFFFAERHTTQSNFRMETNFVLRNVQVAQASGLHD